MSFIDISEVDGTHWDVVIIGSGTAGAAAAIRAAQLGLRPLIIERGPIGGVSVNAGCIPARMMLRIAEIYEEAGMAGLFGILDFKGLRVNMRRVLERKKMIIEQIVKWFIDTVFPSYDIKVLIGRAKLISPHTVKVGQARIDASNIVIATGSRPRIPEDVKGIKEALKSGFAITSDEALSLDEIPDTIVIMGGGAIGVEFASLWSKLGSKVYIVEISSRLLPYLDSELGERLERIFKERGIRIFTSTRIVEIDAKNKTVKLETGETIEASRVLIAIGRRPNVEDLGLDEVGVIYDSNGIKVDNRLRTNVPNIYAVGDVNGLYQLASVAKMEGIVAAENIAGLDARMDYSLVPLGIFSEPEVASVGISARQGDPRFMVSKFPLWVNYHAIAYWKPQGLAKIVVDRSTRELKGFHMIGLHATEVVNIAAIAIKLRLKVDDAIKMIFTYPTASEAFLNAFHVASGLDIYLPRRKPINRMI
ncbi:MAG: dihydrolipoyl dehydrogenase [Pyrodictiaceae archaeon]